MKFPCTILFLSFSIILYCKGKIEPEVFNEDTFYTEEEKGCIAEKPNEDIVEGCIKKKENLFCFQFLKSLKNSKLDKIFYGENWYSNDTQSFRYIIDNFGNVKVLRGGPDSEPKELTGHGKLQPRNKKWHYNHSCERDNCDLIDLDIEFLSCYSGYSSNFNAYVLIVTMKNSDSYETDENSHEQYKEISYVKIINQKPQITNGFTSTKVPPIPSN
ncbi:hypothetical protein [Leptospira bouyouniensis]|uniref:Uncharacterized protein n=1 Tax=Leptospira bouyouniensis TaxID=2484911 RepID=A0ABY2L3R4_9LEPT|nr:hypothetical protein [Leptospira bouyouniensis]TGK46900.1 hypothetical protein EHQ10_16260 [Leptospira bouyouniensis]